MRNVVLNHEEVNLFNLAKGIIVEEVFKEKSRKDYKFGKARVFGYFREENVDSV